jgi:hypothetical protein
MIKRLIAVVALGGVLVAQSVAADTTKNPFSGNWRWKFQMPDGTEVNPRLKLRATNGTYVGTTRFRNMDAPITNVVVQGERIRFDVVREYHGEKVVTHYDAVRRGDTLQGRLTAKVAGGAGESHEWVAERISSIDGAWTWPVAFGERTFDQRLTLKLEGDKLSGKMAGFRNETDIQKARFKDNKVSFHVERRGRDGEKTTNYYRGVFTNDTIRGTWEFVRSGEKRTNEWLATRAD